MKRILFILGCLVVVLSVSAQHSITDEGNAVRLGVTNDTVMIMKGQVILLDDTGGDVLIRYADDRGIKRLVLTPSAYGYSTVADLKNYLDRIIQNPWSPLNAAYTYDDDTLRKSVYTMGTDDIYSDTLVYDDGNLSTVTRTAQ